MSGIPGTQARGNENFIGHLLRNGEYRVEKILGQGGMGRVFLASHTILQIPFAVKQGIVDQPVPEVVRAELEHLLHTELLLRRTSKYKLTEQDFPLSGGVHSDRFLREALLLARLQHSSLPLLYDYFIEDGYWYLVMDYIPGPTLSAYMYKQAPLPPLEALNYAIQLCDVLDYLHKQRPPVVFRDLKPSNILLSPDGRVMLVDFGIARYFKEGQNNDTTEFGSPGYASPEQYKGDAQTDARSDLFSLGVILHEMLSGKRPSGMNSALEPLSQLNPAISAVLSGLVTVATRVEPMYRFQSAHAFYLALERAYRIEERRAYARTLHEVETGGTPEALSLPVFAPLPGEKEMDIFQPTIDMQQRQQTREALQEVRREKLEEEQVESQLDSIDANLSMRSSSMGLTPLPLPPGATAGPVQSEETEEFPLPPPRSTHPLRRVFSVLIGLLLILVLVVASVNIYPFFSHYYSSLVQQPQASPTVTTVTVPTGTWQVLPSLPSPEADNAATYVQIGGRAYVYMSGGFRGPKLTPRYDRNLYRYDIAAAHWEVLSVQNFPGMVNNAVALDEHNSLFFTAGYSSNTYTVASLLYRYAPQTGTVEKIAPPGAISLGFGAAMIADHQGHLYITQGFTHAGDPHTLAGNGWYRYDIATGQWHVLKPLPVGVGYAILAPDETGHIFMLGGARDAGQNLPIKQIYRYDIAQDSWTTEQTPSPVLLSGASSCLNGPQQLVIVGGYDALHNKPLGQTWLLDIPGLHWTPLATLPTGGSVLGSAACDGAGHVYLERGANDPSSPTRDFWQLTLP